MKLGSVTSNCQVTQLSNYANDSEHLIAIKNQTLKFRDIIPISLRSLLVAYTQYSHKVYLQLIVAMSFYRSVTGGKDESSSKTAPKNKQKVGAMK